MQLPTVFALALLSLASLSRAGGVSPIGKVIQLISDLQTKVIKEGEEAQKVYAEYSEWCEDRARDLGHEIKTAKSEVESLEATIAEMVAQENSLTAKIDDLAASIATDEADLKAATEIRAREEKDFKEEAAELSQTISMLERAIQILEREMAKGGASLLQSQSVQSLAQALTTMVQASMMSSADATRLTALVQQSTGSEDSDEDAALGAPAAAVYENQSGNIVDTLTGMLEKAQAQLDSSRKKETSNKHTFEQLKQSLMDEIKFAKKDMSKAKTSLAAASETKATAGGDLTVTQKDLAEDQQAKAKLHSSCMAKAEEFEAETKSRGEELNAIAQAKKIIKEATGGAESINYGLNQVSFIQAARSRLATAADLRGFEAVRQVRDLARKQNSAALAQLAQRMATAQHSSADAFTKIKGLIADMIEKLEAEAGADATKKAYCDKELSETSEKKEDKTAEVEKLTTKIDQMTAKSKTLKEEVADLQSALAKLAKAQAEMDKIREEEHEAFVKNKADMDQGLEGVKMALKVLRDYYAQDAAHDSATGAGGGIIGLLEVIESDFSKSLAEIVSAEEAAAAAYDQETKENEIEKTTKDKDVEHKIKESAYLDKESASLSADRSTVQAELDAVLEYFAKMKGECTEVAETYEHRKGHREAEIAGLKEALETLESETAFLQLRRNRRHGLRGGAQLAA